MRLVFMVEEPSMKALLEILLPQILPPNVDQLIIPHSGKSDLKKSIPIKLQAWQSPKDKFIIIQDQDSNDCKKLKDDLKRLCNSSKNDCLIRIVCTELESWFFGDLAAISSAYEKDVTSLSSKRKYREPDKIMNAKDELRKLIPTYQPIEGAKKIATFMSLEKNTSYSFKMFTEGVRRLCISTPQTHTSPSTAPASQKPPDTPPQNQ
ncbi:MAG: DUF4276 family protein [Defluviitaleaceae bacterium]|nr:DUF4276 family protein [Defluviitaleaceae bacterium]